MKFFGFYILNQKIVSLRSLGFVCIQKDSNVFYHLKKKVFLKTTLVKNVQSDDELPDADPIDCGDEGLGDNEQPVTAIGIDNPQQPAEGKNKVIGLMK